MESLLGSEHTQERPPIVGAGRGKSYAGNFCGTRKDFEN
jgi:hypothetical protein